MIYLLDTDIENYLLKNRQPVAQRFTDAIAAGAAFVLCPVVHYEVTRYLKLKRAKRQMRLHEGLLARWIPVEISLEDWEDAADLWADRHRIGKPIQDADLLIAITARKAGAILVTNNTRHFEGLGLTVENWTTP